MRALPAQTGDNNLQGLQVLLVLRTTAQHWRRPTGQAAHLRVGAKLGVDAQVSQVLLHNSGGQRARVHAQAGSLLHVQLIHHLLKADLNQPAAEGIRSAQLFIIGWVFTQEKQQYGVLSRIQCLINTDCSG